MKTQAHFLKKTKQGFTLVELLVTIGIIGTLAAVAVPKLYTANSYAQNNSMTAVAGAIQQAASNLHAAIGGGTAGSGNAINDCSQAGINTLFDSGSLPAGYAVTNATAGYTAPGGGAAGTACAPGTASTPGEVCSCTLTGPGNAVTFNIVVQ